MGKAFRYKNISSQFKARIHRGVSASRRLKAYSATVRSHVFEQLDQGKSINAVAESRRPLGGPSRQTIRRWVKDRGDPRSLQPSRGRPRKISKAEDAVIGRYIDLQDAQGHLTSRKEILTDVLGGRKLHPQRVSEAVVRGGHSRQKVVARKKGQRNVVPKTAAANFLNNEMKRRLGVVNFHFFDEKFVTSNTLPAKNLSGHKQQDQDNSPRYSQPMLANKKFGLTLFELQDLHEGSGPHGGLTKEDFLEFAKQQLLPRLQEAQRARNGKVQRLYMDEASIHVFKPWHELENLFKGVAEVRYFPPAVHEILNPLDNIIFANVENSFRMQPNSTRAQVEQAMQTAVERITPRQVARAIAATGWTGNPKSGK